MRYGLGVVAMSFVLASAVSGQTPRQGGSTCSSASRMAFSDGWNVCLRHDFDTAFGSDQRPDPDVWVINHPESWWFVLGRTFFPSPVYHPEAPFPRVEDGVCVIEHYLYNSYHLDTPKTTFLGGEIHTVMEFDPGNSWRFEARVRWEECPGGLVTSFFTYGYDDAHSDSDEIDFEFLSNEVFEPVPQVMTNTWDDSDQKPEQIPISELDMTQWNTFRIYWYPEPRVVWTWVEPGGTERVLREETDSAYLPDEPMSVYFNFWAPTSDWGKAYDPNLEPDQEDNGVVWRYWIDYVEVRVLGADTDGDGVADACDECPDTPPGAAVDARGCPTGCCGASGPVAPLGLAVGLLILNRFAGYRSARRRR